MHWLSTFFNRDTKWKASIETKVFRKNSQVHPFLTTKNEEILGGLKVESVDEKLRRHKSNWLWLVTRMDNRRMPKIMPNYRPNGRIRLGRPLKRLLGEAETGLSRPNLWRMTKIMWMKFIVFCCCVAWSLTLREELCCGSLRIECCGGYLSLRGTRHQGSGEDYIIRSLMISTLHQMLFWWSNQEEWDGRGLWLLWGRRDVHTGLWWRNLTER